MRNGTIAFLHVQACVVVIAAVIGPLGCSEFGSAAHASEPAGTVVVSIATKYADGEKFISCCRTSLWVYVKGTSPDATPRIIGKRDVRGNPPAELVPVVQELPPGEYWIDLVLNRVYRDQRREYWDPQVSCQRKITIVSGNETQFRFPDDRCFWSESKLLTPYAHWMTSSSDLVLAVKQQQQNCRKASAPLFNILARVTSSQPSTPAVSMKNWGMHPDYVGDRSVAYERGAREFDASQVRLMVNTLKYHCWPYANPQHWSKSGSADESHVEENLAEALRIQEARLDDLNQIANILDDVARSHRH